MFLCIPLAVFVLIFVLNVHFWEYLLDEVKIEGYKQYLLKPETQNKKPQLETIVLDHKSVLAYFFSNQTILNVQKNR